MDHEIINTGFIQSRRRVAGILAALLLLSACAAPTYYPERSYPTRYPTGPGSTTPPGTPAEAPTSRSPAPSSEPQIVPGDAQVAMGTVNAVDALLDDAWSHYADKDYERAIAVAERALRIDRRNGEVYLVMASSHARMGHQDQARQLARQGLNVSLPRSEVRDRLEGLLDSLGG